MSDKEKDEERENVLDPKKEKEVDALDFVNALEKITDFREFMKDPADIPEEPPHGTQDSIYGPGNPAVHP